MTSKSKKRADVNPAPRGLYRLGQAVRIVASPDPTNPPAGTLRGRIGVVVRLDATAVGLLYTVALWPQTRVQLAPGSLRALTAADHCEPPGLTNACQPGAVARCVWCGRDLGDWDAAVWQAGDLERTVIRGQ